MARIGIPPKSGSGELYATIEVIDASNNLVATDTVTIDSLTANTNGVSVFYTGPTKQLAPEFRYKLDAGDYTIRVVWKSTTSALQVEGNGVTATWEMLQK